MEVRYYVDPDTELPHIYGHGVTEIEVEEVLRGAGEDVAGKNNSRRKIGQTKAGRYLQVFTVPTRILRAFSLLQHTPRTARQKPNRRFAADNGERKK